jgi:hypothetical protein
MLVTAFAALLIGPGSWLITDERSALDGVRSYMAGVESSEPLRNTAGLPETALLSLNCVNGRRTVGIIWPAYLGTDDARVRWKFDGGEIQQRSLGVLRGGKSVVFGGRDAERFLDQVAGAQTLVVEVTGYSGQQEATFSVAGGGEVAAAVRSACP